MNIKTKSSSASAVRSAVFEKDDAIKIPDYLDKTYWWAYLHPQCVKFFDQFWVINTILFGNYKKLRNRLLDDLDESCGDILQLAAVYGDISLQIAKKITNKNRLDVVDVAPIQLQNLDNKLTNCDNVLLIHQDACKLTLKPQSYDRVIVFFLLHEVPDEKKYQILEQALRVLKAGGKITIIDYHKPDKFNPLRYLMKPVLTLLEPYASSLWQKEIISWVPESCNITKVSKETLFAGLYQKIDITL